MTALDLLDDLRKRGIELQAVGDKLRFRPADALSEADCALLLQHKPELLALLAAESSTLPACPTCGGPTHRVASVPWLVVVLCDDGEKCRWVGAMSDREFVAWLAEATTRENAS